MLLGMFSPRTGESFRESSGSLLGVFSGVLGSPGGVFSGVSSRTGGPAEGSTVTRDGGPAGGPRSRVTGRSFLRHRAAREAR